MLRVAFHIYKILTYQKKKKQKVIMASSVHVQISELSLVGFVVGCPFVRRRGAPDVSFQVEQLI